VKKPRPPDDTPGRLFDRGEWQGHALGLLAQGGFDSFPDFLWRQVPFTPGLAKRGGMMEGKRLQSNVLPFKNYRLNVHCSCRSRLTFELTRFRLNEWLGVAGARIAAFVFCDRSGNECLKHLDIEVRQALEVQTGLTHLVSPELGQELDSGSAWDDFYGVLSVRDRS
jgi:hypothetical protein